MTRPSLEAHVYRAEYSSGLLEVFVGAALICVGAAWLADLVPLGAVAPGLLALLWPAVRRRWIAPRAGTVRFRPDRERRQRRSFLGLAALGAAALVLGLVAFSFSRGDGGSGDWSQLVRGFPAALIALGAAAAAAMLGLPRLYGHAVVLLLGAALAVALPLEPGVVFVGTGVALAAAGSVLLARFFAASGRVREP